MAIKRAIKAGDKSVISFKKAIKVGAIAQLLDKNTYYNTQTRSGITATNNGDGSLTINGTATKSDYINFSPALTSIIGGHKILICGNKENSNFKMGLLNQPIQDTGTGVIGIFNQNAEKTWGIEWANGAVINNVTIYPQLFDLTEMFGAGHEPATVAEFRAKFPETYYPYQRAVLTVYNKVIRPCARKGEVVQLIDPTIFNRTTAYDGITYTGNINGFISVSGTATTITIYDLKTKFSDIFPDHIYLITGCPEGGSLQTYNLRYSSNGFGDIGNGVITSGKNINNFRIAITQGTTVENLIFTPQLFDLTAMYGAGNEPKTLAEFRKDFPESYYPYNSIHTKNLWTCNKTAYFYKYDKTTQIYTITSTGSASCYTLPTPLPAGETFTISVRCLSGEIPSDCTVNFGGYHLQGSSSTWQTTVSLPREQDLTGRVFTATEKTTDTLTDFWIFIYAKIPTNLRVMIQFEKGSVATDYVPHDYI